MLTLMLQNISIALYMIFATELIITKQFPYSGSFVSDMNRTIPIKEVIQSLLPSSLFIKYINWCIIPHICHERHGYTRVNFFWPV